MAAAENAPTSAHPWLMPCFTGAEGLE
eukprot:COSAG01_NODE_37697_length_500_cov_0.658354_2_plen_26_part_01